MEDKSLQIINAFRWIARIISGIFVVFFLIIFIGETTESLHSGNSRPISGFDILQLTLMWLGVAGLIAAWIWELYGGILVFLSFLSIIIIRPDLFVSPILFFGIMGGSFILLWWLRFRRTYKVPEL